MTLPRFLVTSRLPLKEHKSLVMWNTAIWRKTWGDQSLLGLAFAVLWAAFPWLYIGLSAQIEMNAFQDVLLRAIPEDWQKMSGVPFSEVATHVGRVALAFVDPVVVLTATVWGVTRGSDAVSGQLERGTLEMILAQPVQGLQLWQMDRGLLLVHQE